MIVWLLHYRQYYLLMLYTDADDGSAKYCKLFIWEAVKMSVSPTTMKQQQQRQSWQQWRRQRQEDQQQQQQQNKLKQNAIILATVHVHSYAYTEGKLPIG